MIEKTSSSITGWLQNCIDSVRADTNQGEGVIITSTDEAIPVPCKRIELIHETDKESVRRIVEMKLAEAGFQFSDEVIEFISLLNISSTRLIESFIISLLYRSVINKKEIDLPFCQVCFSAFVQ